MFSPTKKVTIDYFAMEFIPTFEIKLMECAVKVTKTIKEAVQSGFSVPFRFLLFQEK